MVVQHNLSAINAQNQMRVNLSNNQKATEKLSSGYRINRAGDDAAGLAISEKMRGQIRGLDQATRNAQDGISLIQTAEGALQETHSILQRMRELANQSANGTYDDEVDRYNIQLEVDALKSEIDRISTSTEFNGTKLLDGTMGGYELTITADTAGTTDLAGAIIKGGSVTNTTEFTVGTGFGTDGSWTTGSFNLTTSVDGLSFEEVSVGNGVVTLKATFDTDATKETIDMYEGVEVTLIAKKDADGKYMSGAGTVTVDDSGKGVTFQIGANGEEDQKVTLSVSDMSTDGLSLSDATVDTQDNASDAIASIDTAINFVSSTRANLGALQNRLEHTINSLSTTSENLTAAESRIRDTDMAKEMMNFTKTNILQQASQAMLAQANVQPQSVLQLLG